VLDVLVFEVFGRGEEQFLDALAAFKLFRFASLLLSLRCGSLFLAQLVLDGGNACLYILVVGVLVFQFSLLFLFLVSRFLRVRQQVLFVGLLICRKYDKVKDLRLFINGFTFLFGVGHFVNGQQFQDSLIELFGDGGQVLLLRLLILVVFDFILLPQTFHDLRLGHFRE